MPSELPQVDSFIALLDSVGVSCVLLDSQGLLVEATAGARALLGWDGLDLQGVSSLVALGLAASVLTPESKIQRLRIQRKFIRTISGSAGCDLPADLRVHEIAGLPYGLLVLHPNFTATPSFSMESPLLQGLAIIENAAILLEVDGRIEHSNPSTSLIFGHPAEALLGRSIDVIFDREKQSPEGLRFIDALTSGHFAASHIPVELTGVSREGIAIPLEVRASTIHSGCAHRLLVVMKDLRRRKMTQERLMLLSSAVEQAPAGILIADLNGVVEYVNDGFTTLTGFTPEEVVGRNLLASGSVIPAFARNVPLCWRILSSRDWQGEIRGKHRDGTSYAALVTFSSILGPSGEPIRLLGRFQDTTHQVRDQEALAESEQRFSEVAQLVGEWLWEQDEAGFFTYSSEAALDILGYEPSELIGKHYQELMTDADRKLWSKTLPPASRVQRPFHRLVNHYRHHDGHEIFTESSGTPLLDEQGKVIRWRGVDRDITDRKLAEDQIRLRERAIEAASVGIAIADALAGDYPIIYANSALSRITGYELNELMGHNLRLLQGRGTDEEDREVIRTAVHAGHHCEVIIRNYRKDGQSFWNELQLSPVLDEDERVTHYIGVITDVTERRRAEAERHQLTVAREIQLSLLPKHPVVLPDVEAAGVCVAATQVGGDYYDIVPHGDFIDVIIADVSGHSVGAALIMAEMRSTLKAELRREDLACQSVGNLLSILNELLFPDLDGAELFITMFYLRYHRQTRTLQYASAGHNPPLLLRNDASTCESLDADGLIMGVKTKVIFEERSVTLEPGDRLLLYTDGVVEAQDPLGHFYGMESLSREFVSLRDRHPEATLENLLDRLREFGGDAQFNDDVTMTVFCVKA
jgi:sigma-B regulation protein RsbU (phosphoserine phosphatase)